MRSLNTGFNEMCSLLSDYDFDVFGVTETWLLPGTPSDSFLIPGYSMLRCDRHQNSTTPTAQEVGGGVVIYVKDGILYDEHTLSENPPPGMESLCIVLKVKGVRLGVCVVYRPSYMRYTHLSTMFHSLFVDLAAEVNSVMYLGDTNIDFMNCECNETKYLNRFLKETNTIQLISEPTRVTANSATLLDHIIVDKGAKIKRTGVIDAASIKDHRGIKITDHKLVYCELACKRDKNKAKLITYRDFSSFEPDRVVTQISEFDWNDALLIQGADSVENFITSNIRKIYDEHAPIVCKKVTRKRAPWRTNEIKRLTKLKNKLRNKYWKTRGNDEWQNYKNLRNMLNRLVWIEKKKYFSDKLSNSKNPKDFWSCLKQCDVLGKSNNNELPPEITPDEINNYFQKMGSDINASDDNIRFFRNNRFNASENNFNFRAVTENEVMEIMKEIKSNAVGSDEISIDMIRSVSPFAVSAITHLVNESLREGIFPEGWKKSIVHPLPKTANPKSVQQLRPISILPAFSKILEKAAIRQMITYMNSEHILPKLQSGFRKNHSTSTALLNMFDDLFKAKDEGKYSTVVMLDYSQAFDSLNHELLLAKMHYYGFGRDAVSWFMSYLSRRAQVTRVGSETSGLLIKDRGVPQGSCLGPVLFNLYTSDFPRCVEHCTVHMYADDCQLQLSYCPKTVDFAIGCINDDLQNIYCWSVKNGLKLNVKKCSAIHIAPQQLVQSLNERALTIMLNGEVLMISDTVKILGVTLDSDLSFSDHISQTIQRAVGRLRGLYRFRKLLPEAAKVQLVQSIILSVFQYCYPAYGNSISKENMGRIQKVQNSAIRFVFCLSRRDHVSPFREALHLLPMDVVCRVLTCCLVHKALIVGEPQYLCDKLSLRRDVALRSTRQDKLLHFPRISREVGRKGFAYFGPALYNGLPASLKDLSVASFKERLKCIYVN